MDRGLPIGDCSGFGTAHLALEFWALVQQERALHAHTLCCSRRSDPAHHLFTPARTFGGEAAPLPDFIALVSGRGGPAQVMDTAECVVTIRRYGTDAEIRKELLDYIVFGGDTIRYRGFICPEQPAQAVRYQETPEVRAWALLQSWPLMPRRPTPGDTMAVLVTPLHGEYPPGLEGGIRDRVCPLFRDQHQVRVELDTLMTQLLTLQPSWHYALVVEKAVEASYEWQLRIARLGLDVGPDAAGPRTRRRISTQLQVAVVDLRLKCVIHRTTVSRQMRADFRDLQGSPALGQAELAKLHESGKYWRACSSNVRRLLTGLRRDLSQYLQPGAP